MAEQFQLDSSGTCQSCNLVSLATENTQCFMCNASFHCACLQIGEEQKLGTASLIKSFNRASTKQNFKFFCNSCTTKLEINKANTETDRLNNLEGNMSSIMEELKEIKKLLKERGKTVVDKQMKSDNIWFNKDKLISTKAAPAESMLIINNVSQLDQDSLEKAIVDNEIPVTKSYKNNSGELVLGCDTPESRKKLKDIIASTVENIQMKEVTKKKLSITIVGIRKEYKKEEVISQIVSQNQFVKDFLTGNNTKEHIEIHDIKPTRSNESVYQVFASVSEDLRKGFKNYNDKVVIGLTNCKIYDRLHIKRCNNCQGHGHYYKECPTPNNHCCAKCSLDHPTNRCDVTLDDLKCTNCSKAGNTNTNHAAYDPKCPCRVSLVEKKKKAYEKHLNFQTPTMVHL